MRHPNPFDFDGDHPQTHESGELDHRGRMAVFDQVSQEGGRHSHSQGHVSDSQLFNAALLEQQEKRRPPESTGQPAFRASTAPPLVSDVVRAQAAENADKALDILIDQVNVLKEVSRSNKVESSTDKWLAETVSI